MPFALFEKYRNLLTPVSLSCRRFYGVHLLCREQHPGNPCVFIGESHGRLILAPSFEKSSQPLTTAIRLEPDPPQRGPGSVDEELPQIDIPAFADPQQTRLAPSGVLPWHQPQPRSTLTAILESARITHGGDQGRGRQRPNPGDCLQALAHRMSGTDRLQLLGLIRQPFLSGAKCLIELRKKFGAQGRQLGPLRLEGRQEGVAEFRHTLGQDNAIFS